MSGFWEKAGRGSGDDCWLWSGGITGSGYGMTTICGHAVSTHRLAWEIVNGPIPQNLSVLHRCDVRACCNPSHLFLGTQADNMRDMTSKGRQDRRPGERHHNAKLTAAQVLAARERRSRGERAADLAREYGVCQATMCDALRGTTWSHV